MEFEFNVKCRDGVTYQKRIISLFSNDWSKCQYKNEIKDRCSRKNININEYDNLVDELETLAYKSNFYSRC